MREREKGGRDKVKDREREGEEGGERGNIPRWGLLICIRPFQSRSIKVGCLDLDLKFWTSLTKILRVGNH